MYLLSLTTAIVLSVALHEIFLTPYYLYHVERGLLDVYDQIDKVADREDLQNLLEEIDLEKQVGILISDKNLKNVILSYDSVGRLSNTLDHLDRDIHHLITKEKENLETQHIIVREEEGNQPPRLVFVKKLSNDGFCVLTHPLESLEKNVNAISQFYIIVGGLACIIGTISTLILSKQFTKPILEITTVTESIANMDFTQKIQYKSLDELGNLANNINFLSSKLEQNTIALQNEIQFQKILSQNMSHELKTPISVIQGYIEAVSFDVVSDEATKLEYIQIAQKECQRMTDLINEMLHLSKISVCQDIQKISFHPEEFTSKLLEQQGPLLQQQQIQLELDLEDHHIWGNVELLLQAIGNFVTNAVKYGDGGSLTLRFYQQEDRSIFSLYNSGNRIPIKEIDKIFDIFYMTDKVRSRENNSHGLGLAFSKAVAELHQGRCYCLNREEGVEFFFEIPIK